MSDVLQAVAKTLNERKNSPAETSYVASLYAGGMDKILKKVGEEAAETIIAAKNDDDKALIYETADLWFHSMVMLAARGLGPDDIINELARRTGVSGLDEKAARKTNS